MIPLLLLGIRSFSCKAQCPSRHFKIMFTCCGTWGSRMRAAKCTRLILSIFHQQISTLILKSVLQSLRVHEVDIVVQSIDESAISEDELASPLLCSCLPKFEDFNSSSSYFGSLE